MVQNIPLSDDFAENGGYGAFLTNYIRAVPSTSVAALGAYAVQFGEGTLNQGYKAGFGGVSMTNTASPVVTNRLCCTTWRAFSNLTQTAEAGFKLATTAGSATQDSFRQCCVMVRVQGGTFNDTWQHERNENVTCYMLLIVNTLAQGCQFQLVRINAGVLTVLGTITPSTFGLPNDALGLFANGRVLRLSVIGSGGNPQLTSFTSELDGSNPVSGTPFSDTAVNKITTAGRAGFGMTTDRDEGGGNRSAAVCTYFRAVDDGTPLERLRDEWVRNLWHGASGQTIGGLSNDITDANGISGKRAQQLWACDIYGVPPFPSPSAHYQTLEVDVGSNRLKSEIDAGDPTFSKPTYMVACFAPQCGKCIDRSFVFTYVNPFTPISAGAENELFIMAWDEPGDEFNLTVHAFVVLISFDPLLPGIQVQHLPSGVIYNQVASGAPIVYAINTQMTFRWLVSVTGTTPTRVWKFELRIGGIQIPFTGPANPGWTVQGDGTLDRAESVLGALADTQSAGSLHWRRYNNGGSGGPEAFSDDYRLDSWVDASPACCATTPTLESTPLAIFVPQLGNLFVGVPLSGQLAGTALAIFVPQITLQTVENVGQDPAGQIKTSGAAAGRIATAGVVAGRLLGS